MNETDVGKLRDENNKSVDGTEDEEDMVKTTWIVRDWATIWYEIYFQWIILRVNKQKKLIIYSVYIISSKKFIQLLFFQAESL